MATVQRTPSYYTEPHQTIGYRPPGLQVPGAQPRRGPGALQMLTSLLGGAQKGADQRSQAVIEAFGIRREDAAARAKAEAVARAAREKKLLGLYGQTGEQNVEALESLYQQLTGEKQPFRPPPQKPVAGTRAKTPADVLKNSEAAWIMRKMVDPKNTPDFPVWHTNYMRMLGETGRAMGGGAPLPYAEAAGEELRTKLETDIPLTADDFPTPAAYDAFQAAEKSGTFLELGIGESQLRSGIKDVLRYLKVAEERRVPRAEQRQSIIRTWQKTYGITPEMVGR